MILHENNEAVSPTKGEMMMTLYKMKTLCLSFYIISIVNFSGCDIFDSSESKLRSIECNIIFSVEEGYKNYVAINEPEIKLSMVTEEWYPCCNWSILSYLVVGKNRISVDLIGIYEPRYCSMSFGPATSFSFLNISNGEYPLYFTYRGVTDKYKLTVTDSTIQIIKVFSQFTQPEFTLFWRCPSNSFVYLCGTTTETSWICEDFLDTLLNEIHLEEFQFPDSCGILYPRSSMGYYYDMPAKYFRYKNDVDFDKAGEILESYTHSHSGMGISLINWKNKSFHSWLFENRVE